MYLRLRRRFQITLAAVGLSLLAAAVGVAADAPPEDQTASVDVEGGIPQPFLLDDTILPLVPRHPRTEADQDRVEALSLFSAGRMCQWKEEEAKALRLYQRALRRDPEADTVAEFVVSLATQLERPAEAARYARRAGELEAIDALHMRGLGVHLFERGDWQGAVELYEKALALGRGDKPSAADILMRMEMGRLRHLLDDYENAAEDFALVVDALENPKKYFLDKSFVDDLQGEAGQTYSLMGECFLLADRVDDAAAAFEKAHRANSHKARQGFDLARINARRDRPAEALDKLQVYFDERGNVAGVSPYLLLETLLKDLGKKDELVQRLEKLHAADPENVPLAYFLAERYSQAKQFDKAEPLLVKLSKDSPTITGYRLMVQILRESKRVEELLDLLAEASTRVPSLDSLSTDGKSLCQDKELVEALLGTARKRHEADPDGFGYDHRQATALILLDAKRFDAAGEFLDLAIKADSARAANLLPVWGMSLLMDDRFADAVKVFQRGSELKLPENEAAVIGFYLASALEMDGRTDEALAAAKRAALTDEDSPRLASRVGWVLYHAERLDDAYQVYSNVVKRFDPKHDSAEIRESVREARLILSNICVLRDQLPDAVEWLEEVLDEFPGNIAALNDLGYLWAERSEHLTRAHEMIRAAVDGDPENAAYRDSLGWVLFRLGRPDEALVELTKAAEGEPDPVILDHLGDVYAELKKPDKAKEAWQRSVEKFTEQGDDAGAKKVQAKISGSQ